jgi:hypothetical protein
MVYTIHEYVEKISLPKSLSELRFVTVTSEYFEIDIRCQSKKDIYIKYLIKYQPAQIRIRNKKIRNAELPFSRNFDVTTCVTLFTIQVCLKLAPANRKKGLYLVSTYILYLHSANGAPKESLCSSKFCI